MEDKYCPVDSVGYADGSVVGTTVGSAVFPSSSSFCIVGDMVGSDRPVVRLDGCVDGKDEDGWPEGGIVGRHVGSNDRSILGLAVAVVNEDDGEILELAVVGSDV